MFWRRPSLNRRLRQSAKIKVGPIGLLNGLFGLAVVIVSVAQIFVLDDPAALHHDIIPSFLLVKERIPSTSIDRRRYFRFDEAGLRPLPGTARSHTLPNAVPPRRTIPSQYAEDRAYQVSKRTNSTTKSITGSRGRKRPFYADGGDFNWNHSYEHDNRALYLYNPSVLPLYPPSADERNDPDYYLSKGDFQALTGGDASINYLVTFRANVGGNCFGPDYKKLMATGEQVSYLAVALLDANLDIVPNTDVLVDLSAGPTPHNSKYYRQPMEDCRMFILRKSTHLLCKNHLLRLGLRRNATAGVEDISASSSKTLRYTGKDLSFPFIYPNIYGTGLEITLLGRAKIDDGKNINIFRSLPLPNRTVSTGPYDYYLQVYPLPHRYQRLVVPFQLPDDLAVVATTEREQISTSTLPPPSFVGPDTPNTITTCPENEQPLSHVWITNCTDKQTKPFFGDFDHGTACCLSMKLHNKDVLVGISHQKTSPIVNPWWRRDIYSRYNNLTFGKLYLSRFLAYHSEPPFDIVARSGWFCLGFSEKNEAGGNTLAGRNKQHKMDLFDEVYSCPSIHFVSGISEYIGDDTKAILSYGINDCHPRMMVVEKKEIAKRLLGEALN